MKTKFLLFNILISLFVSVTVMSAFSFVQVNATSALSIAITSFPVSGSSYVTVDGAFIPTPATFDWNIGENHTSVANYSLAAVLLSASLPWLADSVAV